MKLGSVGGSLHGKLSVHRVRSWSGPEVKLRFNQWGYFGRQRHAVLDEHEVRQFVELLALAEQDITDTSWSSTADTQRLSRQVKRLFFGSDVRRSYGQTVLGENARQLHPLKIEVIKVETGQGYKVRLVLRFGFWDRGWLELSLEEVRHLIGLLTQALST